MTKSYNAIGKMNHHLLALLEVASELRFEMINTIINNDHLIKKWPKLTLLLK